VSNSALLQPGRFQLAAQGHGARAVQAQGHRLFLVGAELEGDEFGQAHGAQQAARHARGEGAAGAGQQRQAGPQRVAGGGAGVERVGVEEQVGQLVARQVFGRHGALDEDQARGRCRPVRRGATGFR
jgi:hypothetical protein